MEITYFLVLELSYKYLKKRHRAERDKYSTNLSLRVHRSLSWLQRAEQEVSDPDAQFIFLWIAFNAAYANEYDVDNLMTEQKKFRRFLEKLCKLDVDSYMDNIIWQQYAGSIRVLLDNKFVFGPFWDYCNGKITEEAWKKKFTKSKALASRALSKRHTSAVLGVIFQRLYVLRNQILHGGATWRSSTNRNQLRDGSQILEKIVPTTILIMMDNPNSLWGEPCYPVVKE